MKKNNPHFDEVLKYLSGLKPIDSTGVSFTYFIPEKNQLIYHSKFPGQHEYISFYKGKAIRILHRIDGPARILNNKRYNQYYIDDQKLSFREWKKHPQTQAHKEKEKLKIKVEKL